MAQIKVLDNWDAQFQSTPEYNFKDEDGKDVTIAAVEAHTAHVVKGELQDGTGRVLEFELPDGYDHKQIKVGKVLHIVCKRLQTLDAPLKVKHVTRTLDVKA